ncbi:MAG: hypothetical protein ACD_49C00058G0001 [uncultured bacterium (gcode 4)]|uniref:Uncharacterized protein n=1 Tax=uncultured bacterium (gcode 4) TaxID=1234023 RepID=K2ADW8_9BACT|nr:MAG: hypothetical protein ACD_49C00058G0001 [uncultured bacterium (gcode 4)]
MEWGQMAWYAGAMAWMVVIILVSVVLWLFFSWFVARKINTLVNRRENPFFGAIIFPTTLLILGLTIILWFRIFDGLSMERTLEYTKGVFFPSALIFLVNSLLYFLKTIRNSKGGLIILSTFLIVIIAMIASWYSYYFAYIRKTPGTGGYAIERLEQIRNEEIFGSEPFSCDNMNYLTEWCKRLQIVQEAIKNNNPNICYKTDTLNSGLSGTYSEFALCIWQFPESAVAKSGCKKLKKAVNNFHRLHRNSSAVDDYLVIGKCL